MEISQQTPLVQLLYASKKILIKYIGIRGNNLIMDKIDEVSIE
jgi:hypothetical protein